MRTSVTESCGGLYAIWFEKPALGAPLSSTSLRPDGAPPIEIEFGALLSNGRTGPGSNEIDEHRTR